MSTTKVQLGARVPSSTRDKSVAAAKAAGVSFNQYVEDVLEAAAAPSREVAEPQPQSPAVESGSGRLGKPTPAAPASPPPPGRLPGL